VVDLLVLGGTSFVGPAFVADARSRGWSVTVFNRGSARPPDGAVALQGDRTQPGGLKALEDGAWDVVVDTWSWGPSAVRDAADLLAGRADRYVYVSSRSVYAWPPAAGADESATVVEASPDYGEVDYARAKRGGELAALGAFGDRALLIRAGLILGRLENVGRLPWWLRRIERGGDVLAPGPPDLPLQHVDARDLAAFSLNAAEQGLGGPYNVVSPSGHATMGKLLEACVEVTGSDAELRWTDPEPILDAGIEPWSQLPIWTPPGELHDALHRCDVTRAVEAGLACRPVRETVADTWSWLGELEEDPDQRPDRPRVGIDPVLETEVLAARDLGSGTGPRGTDQVCSDTS
jgi:nucleoside-diphosphate-sugar epimerase